jgi:hypothetical protein
LKHEKSINESLGKAASIWSDPMKQAQSQIQDDLDNINKEIQDRE